MARLPVSGIVSEIGISPSGEIWIATKAGNTYYTEQFGEPWHLGPFGSLNKSIVIGSGTFERVNFFSEDTLMISGYIHGDNNNTDFVYWSGDHGKTWEKIKFGKSSWIDAAYINDKGKAWMSGSSQLIYYSEDYGQTWIEKDKVEKKGNLRFSTIHFANDETTGLFGSFWNVIYRTKDNCETWEKLPTPLGQNKYFRVSKNDRPDIRKIRIFGDYYIANQQGRIFYSRSDSINWIKLPKVIDFEVTDNGSIYTIYDDLSVGQLGKGLNLKWKSKETLSTPPIALNTHNGNLFVFAADTMYKIGPDNFLRSAMLTEEIEIPKPSDVLTLDSEQVGFRGRDVLRFDKNMNSWYRYLTLPFNIGNTIKFEGKIVISDASLTDHYELDLKNEEILQFELPQKLFPLSSSQVKSFSIGLGSLGCFHYYDKTRTYVRRDQRFIWDRKGNKFLDKLPAMVSNGIIDSLLVEINYSRFNNLRLEDLDIDTKTLDNYRSLISKKEKEIKKHGIDRFSQETYYSFPGEYANFDFYKSLADSLDRIDNSVIDQVFATGYGNWSTTRTWHQLIVNFKDGSKLIVANSDDIPNYMYTPWTVTIDGLKYKTNSLKLGRLINELTQGIFFDKISQKKTYAIFQIADYLYRKKINYHN